MLSWLMGFSPGAAVRFGWEAFKQRPWFFVGTAFIILALSLLIDALTSRIDALITGSAEEPSAAGFVINIGLGTLLSMGTTAFYLAAHDNPAGAQLSLLWHPQPFWKYLGASILLTLAVLVGFVLLIVPGIIFGLMFMFAPFIVIEREAGPVDAMSESNRITRGHKWPLFGFMLLLVLINLLGLFALGVGLLVSIPVSTLAFVHAYRVLSGKMEPHPVDAALAA
ncbi:MAG TPA: hypothetical protein VNJ31_10815 [Methyloceanibacter sp.]|nr:hypothetical protein [Methyloceanibacter sp.]